MTDQPDTMVPADFCACGHMRVWHGPHDNAKSMGVKGVHAGQCRAAGCECRLFSKRVHANGVVDVAPTKTRRRVAESGLNAARAQLATAIETLMRAIVRDEFRALSRPAVTSVWAAEPKPRPASGPKESPKLHARILAALIAWGSASREDLAVLTGYSAKAGHYANTIGAMKAAGLIETGPSHRALTKATDAGRAFWEKHGSPKPKPPALIWQEKLQPAYWRLVDAVFRVSLTRDELARTVDLSPKAGHFANLLGRVTSLGLVKKEGNVYRAHDALRKET